jgi:hypothetical protein
MDTQEVGGGDACNKRPEVGPDREVHVYSRLATLVRVALCVNRNSEVRADEDIVDGAIHGAIQGCAEELIREFNYAQSSINLPRPDEKEQWHRRVTSNCTLKY